MSDNTHDPPADQREQSQTAGPLKIDEPPFTPEQLAKLSGPNHEKYQRMKDRLGREPLDLIREMKHGGYRFKTRRGMPGVLATTKGGAPVADRMSFRQIAPILTGMTGVQVTYETVRRWWETVSDEGDEPEETLNPDVVNGPDEQALAEASAMMVRASRRAPRRKPAPVGDEHADAIRAATKRASVTTNPDVPSAVFLPPQE